MRAIRILGYKKRDGTFVSGHNRSGMRGSAPDRSASPEAANAAAAAAASDPLALSDEDRDQLSDSAIKRHDQRNQTAPSDPLVPDVSVSARREIIAAEERAASTAVRLGVDPEAARRTARRRAEDSAAKQAGEMQRRERLIGR